MTLDLTRVQIPAVADALQIRVAHLGKDERKDTAKALKIVWNTIDRHDHRKMSDAVSEVHDHGRSV